MIERKGRTKKACPPEEFREKLVERTVTFRCVHEGTRKVRNAPLEEVRLSFKKWESEMIFCANSTEYRIMKCIFKYKKATQERMLENIENEEWMFYPNLHG